MRHKLIEIKSGAEVKPGMTIIDFKGEIWKLIAFRMIAPPSTGQVIVQNTDAYKEVQEFYPSVFDLKIVEIEE